MKTTRKMRDVSFERQAGRCYYCCQPMWRSDPSAFAERHDLSSSQARLLRLSAEHLRPRSDGGRDDAMNVVAACTYCNNQRHRMIRVLAPDAFAVVYEAVGGMGCGWKADAMTGPRVDCPPSRGWRRRTRRRHDVRSPRALFTPSCGGPPSDPRSSIRDAISVRSVGGGHVGRSESRHDRVPIKRVAVRAQHNWLNITQVDVLIRVPGAIRVIDLQSEHRGFDKGAVASSADEQRLIRHDSVSLNWRRVA